MFSHTLLPQKETALTSLSNNESLINIVFREISGICM